MNDGTVIGEKVHHVRSDVMELRADVRRLDGKIDGVISSLAEHRLETEKAFVALRLEMKDSLARLRTTAFARIIWLVSTVIAATGAACALGKVLKP